MKRNEDDRYAVDLSLEYDTPLLSNDLNPAMQILTHVTNRMLEKNFNQVWKADFKVGWRSNYLLRSCLLV